MQPSVRQSARLPFGPMLLRYCRRRLHRDGIPLLAECQADGQEMKTWIRILAEPRPYDRRWPYDRHFVEAVEAISPALAWGSCAEALPGLVGR